MTHSPKDRITLTARMGFTLIELMVAITLVVLISFLMVPFVTNLVDQMQNRGVTGASRTIQSTFALARDQALRTAAPYGLRFVRDPDNPFLCRQIQFLQTPPALSYDPTDPYIRNLQPPPSQLRVYPSAGYIGVNEDGDSDVDEIDETYEVDGVTGDWQGLVRIGDHLRINHAGPLYEIIGPDIQPMDGLVDAIDGVNFDFDLNIWRFLIAAEPYPNRAGPYSSIAIRGVRLPQAYYRYQIERQPVPAADQDDIVLPPGVVIDLKRSLFLWNQTPARNAWLAIAGNDGKPGIAGVDDDLNGVADTYKNEYGNEVFDYGELGTPGSDDIPATSWPAMDVIFSSTGEMTGDGAGAAVIHLWVGPDGLTSSNLPVELAESRLVSIYTRSGFVQINDINAALNDSGVPDNPYAFAEAAFGARPE